MIGLAEKLCPCVVGMEACCGAHHLGRVFAAHGHEVRLVLPKYVRPYVKAQKNDGSDGGTATRSPERFLRLDMLKQTDLRVFGNPSCEREGPYVFESRDDPLVLRRKMGPRAPDIVLQ